MKPLLASRLRQMKAAEIKAQERAERAPLGFETNLNRKEKAMAATAVKSMASRTGTAKPTVQTRSPNVLIILLDTASARFLSCYGCAARTSPRMDQLAAEGVRFAYCYANGPWTPPSHASLFTGLPSIVHQMNHDHLNVRTREMHKRARNYGRFPTLASLLTENGYQTAGFCGNAWVGEKSNICYGFQFWDNLRRPDAGKGSPVKSPAPAFDRSTSATLEWFDSKYHPDQPYFAFVNYITPHLKRNPPLKYQKRFVKGRVPEYLHNISSRNCFAYIWNGWLKPQDIEPFKGLYAALIAQTDDQIASLLGELSKRGLLDNTIVVICADHGDENGEHNLLDHQLCVYNTLIHVPLIIWHPKTIQAGRVEERPVQLSDLAPTILNRVGLGNVRKQQKQMKGLDLLTEVSRQKRPRPIVSEHGVPRLIIRNALPDITPEQYTPYLRRLKCIIYDGWKHIWSSNGRDELYNLIRDHGETKNLISRYPDRAKSLRARLSRWVRSYGEELERDKKTPRL